MGHELLQKVERMVQSGEVERAYTILRSHAHEFRENDFFFYLKGCVEVLIHRPSEAIGSLVSAVGINPSEPLYYVALGSLYLEAQRARDARVFFERAVAIEPANPKALFGLAVVHRSIGDNLEARRYFHALVATGLANGSTYLHLGEMDKEEGQISRALGHYSKAITWPETRQQAVFSRARCYEELQNYREAVKDYEACLDEEDDQDTLGAILARIGWCYLQMDQFGAAKKALLNALSLCPEAVSLYLNLSAIALQEGDFRSARDYLLDGLKVEDDPELLLQLGLCHLKLSEADKAELVFKRAMGYAQGPMQGQLYWLLGKAYFMQGRYRLARACFLHCLPVVLKEVDPTLLFLEASSKCKTLTEDKHVLLGGFATANSLQAQLMFHIAAGDISEAVAIGEHGRARWPESARIWYYLASALAMTKDSVAALNALRRAVSIQPELGELAKSNPCFHYLHNQREFCEITEDESSGW